ncbi:hypothetical protein AC578_9254 [Pseudocercospora eumusae]|uniref:chitinase n=1 Tax=Pseudocercospora eumusae TaxID=321146 RepID=A0A139HNG6_9PEZI|nr:hypothetical protein AC578_9254 [Pseudocercospora eumusae]
MSRPECAVHTDSPPNCPPLCRHDRRSINRPILEILKPARRPLRAKWDVAASVGAAASNQASVDGETALRAVMRKQSVAVLRKWLLFQDRQTKADREGRDADKANFVLFIRQLRMGLGSEYGITVTLPPSYWYLKGFDLAGLDPYVDWFNLMAYDIHGTWDGHNPYTKAVVQPHTNVTEIKMALDLLWRNDVEPDKVVMGLGFYGRSFTLSNPSCNEPGCAFSSGAKPGECTGTSGVLSNAEIQRLIVQKSLKPITDTAAAIKYIVWDSNQW